MSLNTSEGMYKAVLDGIKKESTAVLTPDRFNRLINNFAVIDWLNEKAPKNDYDQNIVDDLRRLYVTSEVDKDNDKFVLPTNYYRLQSVSFKSQNSDWEPAKRLRLDSLSITKKNPYRTAQEDRLYYLQEGNFITTWPVKSNLSKARLFYLSRPKEILYSKSLTDKDQITDLGTEQCRQIVDIAIRIELERVKEERYQSQLIEENLRMQKQ
jgi:hypothetical protein